MSVDIFCKVCQSTLACQCKKLKLFADFKPENGFFVMCLSTCELAYFTRGKDAAKNASVVLVFRDRVSKLRYYSFVESSSLAL